MVQFYRAPHEIINAENFLWRASRAQLYPSYSVALDTPLCYMVVLMILFVTEIKIVSGYLLYQKAQSLYWFKFLQHSSDHSILYMDLYKEVWDLLFQKTFTCQNHIGRIDSDMILGLIF